MIFLLRGFKVNRIHLTNFLVSYGAPIELVHQYRLLNHDEDRALLRGIFSN